MFDAIRKMLSKPGTTAAALSEAASKIDIAALEMSVATLTEKRARALVEAEDAEIIDIEAKLTKAARDLERGRAAAAEIAKRIVAAQRIERLAAFREERRRIDTAAAMAAKAMRDRYPQAAREIVGLMEAVQAADQRVREWNAARLGDEPEGLTPDEIGMIESVEGRIFEGYHPDGFNGSYFREVRLPLIEPNFAPGYMDLIALHRGLHLKLRAA